MVVTDNPPGVLAGTGPAVAGPFETEADAQAEADQRNDDVDARPDGVLRRMLTTPGKTKDPQTAAAEDQIATDRKMIKQSKSSAADGRAQVEGSRQAIKRSQELLAEVNGPDGITPGPSGKTR